MPTVYKKTLKCIGKNSWMSSPGVTYNLTCGKGVTEPQNLASLRLSSFAESHQMQLKTDKGLLKYCIICGLSLTIGSDYCMVEYVSVPHCRPIVCD